MAGPPLTGVWGGWHPQTAPRRPNFKHPLPTPYLARPPVAPRRQQLVPHKAQPPRRGGSGVEQPQRARRCVAGGVEGALPRGGAGGVDLRAWFGRECFSEGWVGGWVGGKGRVLGGVGWVAV